LVKAGGRLVFATCSVLPQENQAVVNAFLAANPNFTLVSALAECERLGVALPPHALTANGMLQLLPTTDVFSTDGFFAAVMVKKNADVASDAVIADSDITLSTTSVAATTTGIATATDNQS
jgi:16S rRNA (cytosine967-C5)-methyltransferase